MMTPLGQPIVVRFDVSAMEAVRKARVDATLTTQLDPPERCWSEARAESHRRLCGGWVQTVGATNSANFSDGVIQLRVLRGRELRLSATSVSLAALWTDRSVPLGKYWRSNPFVFSFDPRCQGDRGSQK